MPKYESTEPMIIAQIIGKWIGGGVEAVVMNYYRNIDRSKIQFDFICDSDSTNIPYEEIEKLGGRVIIIPPYQKVFKYHKELKRVLKNGNYKIVHSHINTMSFFSLLAAKKAGIPIRIAHSHSTTSKKEFIRNIIKLILRPLNKLVATHYMCCSEYAGRWMFGNYNYNNNKVALIKNAIDLDSFSYDEKIREQYRKKLGINKKQIVIGHVGRMVETKNHAFLINLFAKLLEREDCYLVLIGQGVLENTLREQVEFLGIKEKVIFLGQKIDVNNWYQAFDVFVLPSLYEGFGMALLEAQTSNLPCIASNCVPNEVKLIDDFVFLSLEDSFDLWIENILSILKKNKRKSNVKQFSKAGFSVSLEAKKLSDYYYSIEEKYDAKN